MAANERQHGGDHYKKHGSLQHWDVVAHFDLDYFQGNITKYVFRYRDKGGLEDLYKAKHYLEKLIELEEAALRREGDGEELTMEVRDNTTNSLGRDIKEIMTGEAYDPKEYE